MGGGGQVGVFLGQDKITGKAPQLICNHLVIVNDVKQAFCLRVQGETERESRRCVAVLVFLRSGSPFVRAQTCLLHCPSLLNPKPLNKSSNSHVAWICLESPD